MTASSPFIIPLHGNFLTHLPLAVFSLSDSSLSLFLLPPLPRSGQSQVVVDVTNAMKSDYAKLDLSPLSTPDYSLDVESKDANQSSKFAQSDNTSDSVGWESIGGWIDWPNMPVAPRICASSVHDMSFLHDLCIGRVSLCVCMQPAG
jgi:hypothetical protein